MTGSVVVCVHRRGGGERRDLKTHLVTSGSHCAVKLGHSRACVITKSYRNGVFFFHILYSSLMTRSSTASSKPTRNHKRTEIKLYEDLSKCPWNHVGQRGTVCMMI